MMLIYTALNQEGDYRMNLESKIECIKKVLEKHTNSVKVLGSYVKEINDI